MSPESGDWTGLRLDGTAGSQTLRLDGSQLFFYNNFYYITMEVTSYEYVTEIKERLKESKEDELKIS